MKVVEKDTDRKAEVHLWAQGDDKALDEYGEDFDEDGALVCYVPVEIGQRIRVTGRYLGTTQTVQSDIYVDGVCRRSKNTSGKSATRRSEKLDCINWLVKTESGVVETECEVTALPDDKTKEDVERCPHVGTIEVRLYVLRQFGEERALQLPEQTCFYFDKEDDEYMAPDEGSAKIPAQTYLRFEKNSTILDKNQANRYLKHARSKRPGKQEWAVFRFHYRSKESILEKNLSLTFVDKDKSFNKKPAHELHIEKVDMDALRTPAKAEEDDEEESTARSFSQGLTMSPGPSSPAASHAPKSALSTVTTTQPSTLMASSMLDSPNLKSSEFTQQALCKPTHTEVIGQLFAKENEAAIPMSAAETAPAPPEKPDSPVSIFGNGSTSSTVDAKRLPDASRSSSPPSKRTKSTSPSAFSASGTDGITPKASATYQTKPPISIERQLADARRRTAKAKEDRKRLADKQAAVDKQLEPYRVRMKAELERIQKEAQEFEDLKRQEEERLAESLALLKGFQSAGF
ncbi:hypothetical protein BDV96DRAFT_655798 [Lophiotrema nucula]|uniref:Uncharacterized protein n=1 Tax=Lophiotrema nucula TaxID=690887 RepID=A0A6A5YED0_9PLEO|nr:hypothetical protein BDV96DRAFT_655798 [Lophiotrema nucula]